MHKTIIKNDSNKVVFNVGSGKCYRLMDLLEYIISLTPEKIEIKVDPDKIRPLDNPTIWCDNTLMQKEFGWSPQYTVYDAIDEMFKKLTL